jgi:hypothetical protein
MHLKVMMETYYDLGPGASSAKYKAVRDLISNFGKAEKDCYFDIRKFSKDLQQARGAYEVVFDLTSGMREVIKPVEETAIELLQEITRSESRMIEYAIGKVQEIERSPKEISLEAVMSDVVDRYIRISDAMGQAKSTPSTEKKKGEKSTSANPAIRDDAQVRCQICQLEHTARDCPQYQNMLKQASTKRGDLFPGQSNKERRRGGAKHGVDFGQSRQQWFKMLTFFLAQMKVVALETRF